MAPSTCSSSIFSCRRSASPLSFIRLKCACALSSYLFQAADHSALSPRWWFVSVDALGGSCACSPAAAPPDPAAAPPLSPRPGPPPPGLCPPPPGDAAASGDGVCGFWRSPPPALGDGAVAGVAADAMAVALEGNPMLGPAPEGDSTLGRGGLPRLRAGAAAAATGVAGPMPKGCPEPALAASGVAGVGGRAASASLASALLSFGAIGLSRVACGSSRCAGASSPVAPSSPGLGERGRAMRWRASSGYPDLFGVALQQVPPAAAAMF